ncbi:hypothetical protein ES703_37449 [subsurface metagenome]
MEEREVGVEAAGPAAVGELVDDVYDGLFREVVSREIAHREGRPEGRTVVVELPEGEGQPEFISYGRPDMVEAFDKRLDLDKVKHRGVAVGGFPESEDKVDSFRAMIGRRIEAAQEKRKGIEGTLGLPALPAILADKLDEIAVRIMPGNDVDKGESEDE